MPDRKTVPLPPNIPVTLKLEDPYRDSCTLYDEELRIGRYVTLTGEFLALPRPAAILLNALDAQPGEEITVCRRWSGRTGEPHEFTVELTARSEQARAKAESDPGLLETLEASIEQAEQRKAAVKPPTPIRKPVRAAKPDTAQPRLFDRGTGTDGPSPQPAIAAHSVPLPAIHRNGKPPQIPANVAVREILAFIQLDPSTQNWSDQARQDLASTVYIAACKAGQVGLWERGE